MTSTILLSILRLASPYVAVGLLFTFAFLGCDSTPSSETTLWTGPANEGHRIFVDVSFDTLWVRGGEQDTVLLEPTIVRPMPNGVAVYERGVNQVIGLGPGGELLWKLGRSGAGPSEFRDVIDLVADDDGTLHIFDAGTQRVTRRAPDGDLTFISIDPDIPRSHTVAISGNGGYLFVALHGDAPVKQVDSTGQLVRQMDFPWLQFNELSAIARQGTVAQDGERWAYFVTFGNAWFPFRNADPVGYVGQLVEHDPFASVFVTQTGSRRTTTVLAGQECGPCSASIVGDEVHVFHGGDSDDAYAIIDVYKWSDGHYVHSYRLPHRYRRVFRRDSVVYALHYSPFPVLEALVVSTPGTRNEVRHNGDP